MGQLIKFPKKSSDNKLAEVYDQSQSDSDAGELGKLLFFTGVRYDRQMSLPSQRILPTVRRN